MGKVKRAIATIIRVRGIEAGTWALALALPNNQRLPLKAIKCNRISKAVRNFDLTASIPFASGKQTVKLKGVFSMGQGIAELNEEAGTIFVDELKLTKKMQAAIGPLEEATA